LNFKEMLCKCNMGDSKVGAQLFTHIHKKYF
jgi:hypothetical protein